MCVDISTSIDISIDISLCICPSTVATDNHRDSHRDIDTSIYLPNNYAPAPICSFFGAVFFGETFSCAATSTHNGRRCCPNI